MTDFGAMGAYYATFDEWARLETPAGRVEFERTLALLDAHLPARSRVLDLGGGPGRYTVALAQRGHVVSLADLSNVLLDQARDRIAAAAVMDQVASIDEVNALDLCLYEDAAFDAVLAAGPFYHLTREGERRGAAGEIARVIRPNGLVFAAFFPRLSGLAGLVARAAEDPAQVTSEAFNDAAETGVFRNATDRGFQEGYFADPADLEALFEETGFTRLDVVSLRGIADGHEAALAAIAETDPCLHGAIAGVLEGTAHDPTVVASCGHGLYVGRKG